MHWKDRLVDTEVTELCRIERTSGYVQMMIDTINPSKSSMRNAKADLKYLLPEMTINNLA